MMLDCLAYLSTFLGMVVTNKASLQLSRKNLDGAGRVVSDALVIGAILGTIMAACLYMACPVIIKAMAGQASASIVGPATSYVRIRYAVYTPFSILLLKYIFDLLLPMWSILGHSGQCALYFCAIFHFFSVSLAYGYYSCRSGL